MRAISRVVLALSVSGIAASSVDAQVRGSERSVISQVVDGTTITVDYARPHARGRGAVWGNLVDWNHLWTPGANWATTFDFSKDVHLNGTPVPAGKYSVWMVAGPDEFEVVLDPDEEIFHVRRPERSDDQISLMAKAVEAPFREALTFSFPEVRADGTDILFQWGALKVPMEVKVPSTQVTTISAAEAAPYPGTYDVTGLWSPEEEAAVSEAERWLGRSVMEIRHDGEHLVADWDVSARFGNVPTMFLPVAEGIFHPGWMSNGKLMETETMLWVEFQVVDGVAVGWEMRDDLFDEVILRAVRRK